jgi:two-component sensor histidine kinase
MFPLGEGLGVLFHDVSERRDAQEALRARTAALEAVLDTIPTAVWFTQDPEVREVVRNRRAAEILRMPPVGGEPLAAMPYSTFRFQRDGHDLSAEELPLRRAARGETVEGELMELVHDNGDRRILLTRAAPLRGPDGAVFGAVCAAADVTERHRYEAQLKLLLDELDHRVKNTLTIVQSIAALTLKDVDAATRTSFERRLMTLGEVHGLLTRHNWAAAELADVLRAALRSLVPMPDRVTFEGASLRLQPRTAVTLSLAAHELATNAVKYGALSTAAGRITIGWSTDGERFRLSWTECGGPRVTPPTRQGFGTRMIQQALAGELRGEVTMDYRPEGLVCTVDGLLAAVQDGGDRPPSAP